MKEKVYNNRDKFLNDDDLTEEEKIELAEMVLQALEYQEKQEEQEREM